MPRAKRHHVVPKRYLKLFANQDGRLRGMRRNGPTFITSTVNAAVETDFYTVTDADAQQLDVVETTLASWESQLFPGLEAILGGEWPPQEHTRERAALWMALQHLRTRTMRELSRNIGTTIVEQELDQASRAARVASLVRQHPEASGEEVSMLVDETFDGVAENLRDYTASASFHAEGIDRYVHVVADEFLRRRWDLMRLQRKALITSDNPVALHRDAPVSFGVRTAVGITFPISRRLGLFLRDGPGQDQVLPGTTRAANAFNRGTIATAHSSVYWHPADDALTGVVPLQSP